MLKVCRSCQRFHGPSILRCPQTGEALELAGRELGERYRLCARVGQSATAQIWKGLHLGTQRRVAIKMLRPECLDDMALRGRFEKEAQLAARVHSDYVVSVFDQGQCALGPYLVMDWVQGETLQARVQADHAQAGPWPLDMVGALARALALALVAIHEAGVVHRDLKPANVMVYGYGARLGVKVLDFGVAKALHAPGSTAMGHRLGTLQYMAPEQREDASGVDERADLYALGVILRQLLTGQDTPDAPALRAWRAVPEAWRGLCERLLATDPGARFQSARALYDALQAEATNREPTPPVHRPLRSRVAGALASASAGALIAGAISARFGAPAWGPAPKVKASALVSREVPDPPCSRCEVPPALQPAPVSSERTKPSSRREGTRRERLRSLEPLPKPQVQTPWPTLQNSIGPGQLRAEPPLTGPRIKPSPTDLPLEVKVERSSQMGFFDARQYCQSLAKRGHRGLSGWRLAKPHEVVGRKDLKRGWYWTDHMKGGRAQVVAVPSGRQFYARVRRRFIRPLCVAFGPSS